MDAGELKRLKRMAESIALPEEELRRMQIDLAIELGGAPADQPDKLQELEEENERRRQAEVEALLARTADKSPEVRERVLAHLEGRAAVSVPFTPAPDDEPEEEMAEIEVPDEVRVVAPRVDTKASLQVGEDGMHAWLTLLPPSGGGRAPTEKMLEAYLKKKGVVFGINRAKLKQAILEVTEKGKPVTDFEIAAGRPVEPGKDGIVDVKFSQTDKNDFAGTINDEGTLSIGGVHKDQILLTLTPAQPGRNGMTVTGQELKAAEVKRIAIELREGVRRAGENIVAQTEGIVYYYENAIAVKPYADCRIDVSLAEDRMSAAVSLKPAVGDGQQLSLELVLKALKNRKICHGIDEGVIRDAVEKCNADRIELVRIPVARGVAPVHGSKGTILFKIKLEASHELKEKDPQKKIDYHEKDSIVSIAKGTLIALHYPPGKKVRDGMDVTGLELPGQDGEPAEVKLGKNIEVRENGEARIREYLAKIDGQVLFEDSKLDVETLFIVSGNLTLEIGNIDFPGNVLVKGNIEDDFIVKAGGDIEVRGNVGASRLEAGRDVYIKGGAIGRGAGSIRAGRNIFVRFAENARLTATRTITIERASLNSRIAAGNSIFCKKEKGQIIGGHMIARNLIEVKDLGTPAGTRTEVTAGLDFFQMEQIAALEEEHGKFQEALEKIEDVLGRIERQLKSQEETPREELRKSQADLLQKKLLVQKKLHELRMKKAEISLQQSEEPAGEIVVLNKLETDVVFNIGNQTERTRQSRPRQHVYADPKTGKLTIEPYTGRYAYKDHEPAPKAPESAKNGMKK